MHQSGLLSPGQKHLTFSDGRPHSSINLQINNDIREFQHDALTLFIVLHT